MVQIWSGHVYRYADNEYDVLMPLYAASLRNWRKLIGHMQVRPLPKAPSNLSRGTNTWLTSRENIYTLQHERNTQIMTLLEKLYDNVRAVSILIFHLFGMAILASMLAAGYIIWIQGD